MKGALISILQNCKVAFEELKRLNKELKEEFFKEASLDAEVKNLQYIGDLHRMMQDYLIVRVAGLFFDNDSRTASFQNFCPNDIDYLLIKKEPIVQYLIKLRHNFVAHSNLARMQNGKYPETFKILESNISEIFQKLLLLTEKY